MIANMNDEDQVPMYFIPKIRQSIPCVKSLKKAYALYINIPFCDNRCYFCSIPVLQLTNRKNLDNYVENLLHEMTAIGKMLKNYELKGIHIGGGTPSILSVSQIKKIFDALTNHFGSDIPEIVFEANPESMNKEKIDVLTEYRNVTLNFGIQTFDSERLRKINRMDMVEGIKDCLHYAVKKTNLHVGIDLIVGLPGSKMDDFNGDMNVMRELGIKNVFIYPYRLEEKSFFYHLRNDANTMWLSQNELIRNVEYAEEKMRKNGYIAKTIYYWTKEEKNLYLYNFHQMNGNEWVGIGAGAYSYLEHSVIYNDLWEWKKHNWFTESNEEQIFRQNVTEQLIWDLSFEVKSGNFDVKILIQKYGEIAKPYLWKIVRRLKEKGYLQRKNNIICLSVKGKVLLDDVDKIIREVVLN